MLKRLYSDAVASAAAAGATAAASGGRGRGRGRGGNESNGLNATLGWSDLIAQMWKEGPQRRARWSSEVPSCRCMRGGS
eukprot:354827-Chlamydomonas_euryale.AAC.2